MFWPSHATGRKISVPKRVKVPILGGAGEEEEFEIMELVNEYRRDRQVREDKWLISKWLSPEELILGGSQGLGRGYASGAKPASEVVIGVWKERFPGADFPSSGWRVATSATLPRSPDSEITPNLPDTEWFIACVRAQTAPTAEEIVRGIHASMDAKDEKDAKLIGEEAAETWPAFLNIKPGARGGDISVPFTKFDHAR